MLKKGESSDTLNHEAENSFKINVDETNETTPLMHDVEAAVSVKRGVNKMVWVALGGVVLLCVAVAVVYVAFPTLFAQIVDSIADKF